MRIALVVHGFVQGVGYRYFVKKAADSLGVKGFVENKEDGSVLIVAESDAINLEKLESDINVSMEHGIQVLRIEKFEEADKSFPTASYDSSRFLIKK